MLNQLEWLALFGFLVAWYAPFSRGSSVDEGRASSAELGYRTHYNTALSQQPLPLWISEAIWLLIYGLNAGASFAYWRGGDAATSRYQSTLIVLLIVLFISKTRSPLFFGARAPLWVLVGLIVLVPLVVALLVLSALDALWLATALFVPYTLWLLVAIGLQWRFYTDLQSLRRSNADARQRSAAPVRGGGGGGGGTTRLANGPRSYINK